MSSGIGLRRRARAFVVSVAAMLAAPVWAGPCESGFQEVRVPDGARFYTAALPYPSVDARDVLARFASLAGERGYIVIAPADLSGKVATLGIAKPPAPGPVMISADPRGKLVSVTSIVPPGPKADPTEQRTIVCGLLAAFDATTHGGAPAPARAAAADRIDADPSRTALPTAIPSVELLSPTATFDAAAARRALEPGSAVIRGQACGGVNGALAYARSVVLYPATPYLDELLEMGKRAKSGGVALVPEPEALATRMVANADSEGRFQFSKMKPGRYYLTAYIAGVFGGTRDVQIGRVEGGFGSANVYAKEGYTFDSESEVGKFVTVRGDGDVVSVTLQPPVSANPFKRGLRGSLLGCRTLP